MSKCTFTIVSGRDGQLTLSRRRCKLFACLVRSLFGVLSWVRLLTVSTFRLNSRDRISGWSNADSQNSAFNSTSIRFESVNKVYEPKPSQRNVSVTVCHSSSTTSNFARRKSDHDVETTVRDTTLGLCVKTPSITNNPRLNRSTSPRARRDIASRNDRPQGVLPSLEAPFRLETLDTGTDFCKTVYKDLV
jgi:hypothetical protein